MDKQYASALFDIVKEDKTLNEAKESFDVFVDVLNSNIDFWNVLNSPKIKTDEKKNLIKETFKPCLEDFILFLYVVLDNGRIDIVSDIYEAFLNLYNEANLVKNVLVLSANKLEEKELKELKVSLEKYYAGYKVIINNKIDPSVIGGYHILVNGLSIDLSVKHKIDSLKSTL